MAHDLYRAMSGSGYSDTGQRLIAALIDAGVAYQEVSSGYSTHEVFLSEGDARDLIKALQKAASEGDGT